MGGTSICQKYRLHLKAHRVLTSLQILVCLIVYVLFSYGSIELLGFHVIAPFKNTAWCFAVFHSSWRGVHLKHISSFVFWLYFLYFGFCRALGWILAVPSGFCCYCCIYSKTFYVVIPAQEPCLDTYFNNNCSLETFQISVVQM